MKRGGFSIVEIMVTIVILGILIGLGVVAMSSSQVSARDAERESDAESIAMQFESYFSTAISTSGDSADYFTGGGSYPGTAYMNKDLLERIFPEVDRSIFRAPGVSLDEDISIIAATNTNQINVYPYPEPNTYVYQALTKTNTLCTDPAVTFEGGLGGCVKFNLFYMTEADNAVHVVRSKNR